jgi:hypothetical protein
MITPSADAGQTSTRATASMALSPCPNRAMASRCRLQLAVGGIAHVQVAHPLECRASQLSADVLLALVGGDQSNED